MQKYLLGVLSLALIIVFVLFLIYPQWLIEDPKAEANKNKLLGLQIGSAVGILAGLAVGWYTYKLPSTAPKTS